MKSLPILNPRNGNNAKRREPETYPLLSIPYALMVFSSPVFLFLFLPIVLGVYFVAPTRLRNLWLTLTSLLFYAWGAKALVVIMLVSIGGNYLLGRWIDRKRDSRFAPWIM